MLSLFFILHLYAYTLDVQETDGIFSRALNYIQHVFYVCESETDLPIRYKSSARSAVKGFKSILQKRSQK